MRIGAAQAQRLNTGGRFAVPKEFHHDRIYDEKRF